VSTGHPCFGCTEKNVGFTKPIYEKAELFTVLPPNYYPKVSPDEKGGISPGAAAILGGIAGAAAGAGYVVASKKSKKIHSETKSERD